MNVFAVILLPYHHFFFLASALSISNSVLSLSCCFRSSAKESINSFSGSIFLYIILDNVDVLGRSISFQKLLNADNSPGNVFVMTPDALVSKISELTRKYDGIVYKEDAGVRELQINGEFNKESILDQYYGRN